MNKEVANELRANLKLIEITIRQTKFIKKDIERKISGFYDDTIEDDRIDSEEQYSKYIYKSKLALNNELKIALNDIDSIILENILYDLTTLKILKDDIKSINRSLKILKRRRDSIWKLLH